MERNLSTLDVAEHRDLIDGSVDAQQANLNTAPVMGEWTKDVRAPTLLPFDDSSTGGYTFKTISYYSIGTNHTSSGPVADSVVMDLTDELSNEGKHFCTDIWYISVSPAEKLLQKKHILEWRMQKE
ncbi:hypothetical protein KIN20_015714 [Parelaphostrongylus tenuis]|uniref:Uncharacterized protein n=1 Tax=Parelaphostrongylus tenuis TaxID=148309 RepID=A0AAD5MK17_PARTN|nr:hypothetical protein KIN20_015714 [Parelaphostrongylus tenuis]